MKLGFKEGTFPAVDYSFVSKPFSERVKILSLYWAESGFGTPRQVHMIYLMKFTFLWGLLGTIIITSTSGLGWFWEVGNWWNQPIFYQKLIIWTMFLEGIGLGGSWGILAGHFKPMTGGILYFARPGTIRLRPWRWVPGTNGDTRTVFDVILYLGFQISLFVALVMPGVTTANFTETLPNGIGGLVQPVPVIAALALLMLVGLRDKTIFLAARGEQYLPALVFFLLFQNNVTDLIISLKLLLITVWVGAAISKFGKHFTHVVPPMLSNTPFWPPRSLRLANYANFEKEDLRPSRFASAFSHIPGTLAELVVPLILLFSLNNTVTFWSAWFMVAFCVFIISTFPLAVPIEWNTLFAFAAVFLFVGFPNGDGFSIVRDFSNYPLLWVIVAAMLFFPILGNLRPDKVSFLPSLRQYAGNWASASWMFKPGAEKKLNEHLNRPALNQIDQLGLLGYDPFAAEVTSQLGLAWRSMHTQGKGLFSLGHHFLPDFEQRNVREAEFGCNSVIGFNFGDGHLHNEDLIFAMQRRCNFEPGEFVVMWVESQPIHKLQQQWKVIDANLGIIAKGTWQVNDLVGIQPWLPDGPVPVNVTWRSPRFEEFTAAVQPQEGVDTDAVAAVKRVLAQQSEAQGTV